MEMGGGVFQVKSTSGDTQLGGTNGQASIDYIAEEFRNSQQSIFARQARHDEDYGGRESKD